MRGRRNPQITMLALIALEERVPTAHPLRTIDRLADEALRDRLGRVALGGVQPGAQFLDLARPVGTGAGDGPVPSDNEPASKRYSQDTALASYASVIAEVATAGCLLLHAPSGTLTSPKQLAQQTLWPL